MFYGRFSRPATPRSRVLLLTPGPPRARYLFTPTPRALPILGPTDPFQYGAAVIDPAELYFRAGNAIGGPLEAFRGVTATRFPFYASILGPGGSIGINGVGISGAPI